MTKSIYLALDFPNWLETNHFLETNDLRGIPVKVGMELYYQEGPKVIEKLKQDNHKIFLDLKLFDIPTTVMRAMKVIAGLEVDMINVHALGGSEMIKLAKEGLLSGNANYNTKLIAVTVLTSMSNTTLNEELMIPGDLTENAIHFARFSQANGADGVVCSVHEANAIKTACGKEFATVTPGIRLDNAPVNDQQRIATPGFAKQNGADYPVIGRTVTHANNPREAYYQAIKEWEEAR
ncbi:orotidine-5'-phosphate decarboxylase [Ornithinibacillus contaminans]|uniref:orotidine-5'-phosphate decarboxylase n=1 Tax=Ornithinibacillus contaminans TaxID=694055 RepID=UPI00064D9D34|nr:orotidine-5'-phosphate decarboxylase [Ornithinibacillus contaminans]